MGIVENIEKIIGIIRQAEHDKSEKCTDHFNPRDVLVGVVKSKKQFEIAMRMRFYHIPMVQIYGCQMPVKYVALYQSKKKFGRESGIRYYGEVENYKTVRRSEIREIPKNSFEPYLYIKIKRWRKLTNKISAKAMDRIAFSTSLYLLKNSSDSEQLFLTNEQEYDFYTRLVGTVKKMIRSGVPSHDDMVFGDHTLKFQDGLMYLYFGDALQYVIGYDLFLESPMSVIRDIFDYYPEYDS